MQVLSDMRDRIARLERRAANDVGTILINPNPIIPANHLACDGSFYSKTDYDTLYAVLGSRYGATSTTFAVPNLLGRFPLGAGQSFGVGEAGGEEEHTLIVSEIPAHSHGITDPGHSHLPGSGQEFFWTRDTGGANVVQGGATYQGDNSVVSGTANATTGITISNAGGGIAHNNMPPYLGVQFIIVAR